MKTFNKITISFTLLICLLFSYSLLYQVYLEQTGPIYDNTLRFHVRADSDKKEAQERKLIVRDAVLRYVKEDVYRADSAQKLKQNLAEKTEEIAQVAANASDGSLSVSTLPKKDFQYAITELPFSPRENIRHSG